MTQNNSDECFLLHQRAYGETSLIADVFTKKNGKMSLIAKGAKKPKSKFFGYLVPFHKLYITYSGRSDLKTLTSIDRNLSNYENTMTKTSYSLLYINELLTKLLPKDAKQEDLFTLYERFLNEVNLKNELELTLRHFELDLLDLLGYGFDYNIDFKTNELIDPNKGYYFEAEKGFRISDNLNFLGKDIINIKKRNLHDVPKKILKDITTKAIGACLDGKELASRKIFKKIN
tara:strand:+ start:12583 stop:13275 length:693 start_codon:yes stop_codon:yes gene_type:complete